MAQGPVSCFLCSIARAKLPQRVFVSLGRNDTKLANNYAGYVRSVRTHFCPGARIAGIQNRCGVILLRLAARIPDSKAMGLWVWLLRDELGKIADQAQVATIAPSEERGHSVDQILDAYLTL